MATADALAVEWRLAKKSDLKLAPVVWETVVSRHFAEAKNAGNWPVCLELLNPSGSHVGSMSQGDLPDERASKLQTQLLLCAVIDLLKSGQEIPKDQADKLATVKAEASSKLLSFLNALIVDDADGQQVAVDIKDTVMKEALGKLRLVVRAAVAHDASADDWQKADQVAVPRSQPPHSAAKPSSGPARNFQKYGFGPVLFMLGRTSLHRMLRSHGASCSLVGNLGDHEAH